MRVATPISTRRLSTSAVVTASALLLAVACTPAFEWRRLQVAEVGLALMMPCKPQRLSDATQGLWQCEADGMRFVLTWLRLEDPQQAQQRLAGQADALALRLGAKASFLGAEGLPAGAVQWTGRGRYRLEGGVREAQLQLWVQGLHLCQALVLSQGVASSAREMQAATAFMDSIQKEVTP